MKKYIRTLITALVILVGVSFSWVSFSQPPAPPPSGDNGGSQTPMGGGPAPIDGGLVILLAAGIGYGTKKVYHAKFANKKSNH